MSKTTDLAGIALVWVATMAEPGSRGYVIASDKDQAALLTDAAAGLVARTPELRGSVEVASYKITAKSGATVEVLAADGGSMFGLRGKFYVCDELAQWGETPQCSPCLVRDRVGIGQGEGLSIRLPDQRWRAVTLEPRRSLLTPASPTPGEFTKYRDLALGCPQRCSQLNVRCCVTLSGQG